MQNEAGIEKALRDVVANEFRSHLKQGRAFVGGGVLTTVDAVNAALQVDHRAEAVRQIAAADRIVLTKTDLADPEAEAGLRARLARINPTAGVMTSEDSVAEILGGFGPATFVAALLTGQGATRDCGLDCRDHTHSHHAAHHATAHTHPDPHTHPNAHHHDAELGVTSFSLVIEGR
nr:GTP-binding protein [uncultured Celeribacter sp.]